MRGFRWPPIIVCACLCHALPCLAMARVEGKLIEPSSCSKYSKARTGCLDSSGFEHFVLFSSRACLIASLEIIGPSLSRVGFLGWFKVPDVDGLQKGDRRDGGGRAAP
jgi:hypothetical protein